VNLSEPWTKQHFLWQNHSIAPVNSVNLLDRTNTMRSKLFYRYWFIGLLLLPISGCSCGDEEPVKVLPITEKEKKVAINKLNEDARNVEAMFLTEDGTKVFGARYLKAVIDPESGKIAHRVQKCTNPDCPGRGEDGEPLLFPWVNKMLYLGSDGEINHLPVQTKEEVRMVAVHAEVICPVCVKTRKRSTESEEVRDQYRQWCKAYVPPRALEQLKELEDQRKELYRRVPKGHGSDEP